MNETRSSSPLPNGEPSEKGGVTPSRPNSMCAFRRIGDSNGKNRSLSSAVQFRNASALGGVAASVQLNGTSSSSNVMQGVMSSQTDEVLKLKKQVSYDQTLKLSINQK